MPQAKKNQKIGQFSTRGQNIGKPDFFKKKPDIKPPLRKLIKFRVPPIFCSRHLYNL